MSAILRIGNAQAFWGDRSDAAAELLRGKPDLDYITLDYLAEVSMSILALQRQRDANAGYAADFLEVVTSLAPAWKAGSRVRIITNAGGLNPQGCARAVAEILKREGCPVMKIGVVSGDDVLPLLRESSGDAYKNLESKESLDKVRGTLVTANAYIGADPLAEALRQGAQIVVTGRVADPSLTVAACAAQWNWKWDDHDRLAGATVAGHLIECGTHVTGGISTDWLDVPDAPHIGFPIAEVDEQGHCVITKPKGSGGRVNAASVKEQLLYEIGDPAAYLSPDVGVSFLGLRVTEERKNRVRVQGAIGRAPPLQYKVSATYRAGFRATGMLTIFGRDAVRKARRCAEMVRTRLQEAGSLPERWQVECLGSGDVVAGVPAAAKDDLLETVLRISVADARRPVVERFTKELMPLVTSGPQGTTGYAEGRPRVHEVFGYWPCLVDRELVKPRVEIVQS